MGVMGLDVFLDDVEEPPPAAGLSSSSVAVVRAAVDVGATAAAAGACVGVFVAIIVELRGIFNRDQRHCA